MDFVHDALYHGRRFRCLTIVDQAGKQSPAIEVDFSLPGPRVVSVLDRLKVTHGLPRSITVDHGPEFESKALDQWAYENQVELHFIRPGKPIDNAFIESFNGRFREECLDENWFLTLKEAQERIEAWRKEYNNERPHSSLGGKTPNQFVEEQKMMINQARC